MLVEEKSKENFEGESGALRHEERFDPIRTRRLGWVSFLFGFAGAFPLYVASSYFALAIGGSNVSVFYLLAFGAAFLVLFFLHAFLRALGASAGFLILLSLVIVAQVPILLLPVSIFGAAFLVLYFLLVTVSWVALDIVLENFSEDRKSGRIRSLHLTAMNAGLLLAPFLSTHILDRFGFHGVFLTSLFFFVALFFLALFSLYGVNIRRAVRVTPFGVLRSAFRRVDIVRIYAVSFAMEFFYAAMIVYTPIRLRALGMEWNDIGIVLTIMLIPFVLVQYPLGVLADKKTGEKELLIGAIFVAAVSTAAVAFLASPSVALWGGVLFATRLGIAAIEVLRDSYFYKRIDGGNPELIAFFRTAGPAANIAAAAVIGLWLFVFPLSSIFFLPAIVLLFALIPAFLLDDNRSEGERGTDNEQRTTNN